MLIYWSEGDKISKMKFSSVLILILALGFILMINANVSATPCNSSLECNDGNTLTIDECINPGSVISQCRTTAINCAIDLDCGITGFIGGQYCTNDNSYQNFQTAICRNNGTTQAFCDVSVESRLVQQCSDLCSAGLCLQIICHNNLECSDGNSSTQDSCMNPGTTNSSCSHNQITCFSNSDCGTNGFVNASFCSDKNITRNFLEYTCNNGGTTSSFCSSNLTVETTEQCEFMCTLGSCVFPRTLELNIISPENKTYSTNDILVSITGNGTSTLYSINGGANQSYASSVFRTFLNGTNDIKAYTFDEFGNSIMREVVFSVVIPSDGNNGGGSGGHGGGSSDYLNETFGLYSERTQGSYVPLFVPAKTGGNSIDNGETQVLNNGNSKSSGNKINYFPFILIGLFVFLLIVLIIIIFVSASRD